MASRGLQRVVWGFSVPRFGVLLGVLAMLAGCAGGGVPENEDSPAAASPAMTAGEAEEVGAEPVEPELGPPRGVVVEEIGPGSALEKAGLQVGDVVLSWRRLPNPPANPEEARGELRSPFDWMWMEIEQAPRGVVELHGERDGARRVFEVQPTYWEGSVRPRLTPDQLALYRQGREQIGAGDTEQGVLAWRTIATEADGPEAWRLGCWLQLRSGDAWVRAREWENALAAYQEALGEARDATRVRTVILEALGTAHERRGSFEQAEQAYRSVLEIRGKARRKNLGFARAERLLGRLVHVRGEPEMAREHFERAVRIVEQQAPDSWPLCKGLGGLGIVARVLGDLASAETHQQRVLAILQKNGYGEVLLAGVFNNLGSLAISRGDLTAAESYLERAAAIYREHLRDHLPESQLDLALAFGNLGLVAHRRDDLDTAEDYQQRALTMFQEILPESPEAANALNNLGVIALHREDFEAAESYHRRALAIWEKQAPDGLDVAASFNNLGNIARARGDVEEAEQLYQWALAIWGRRIPNSLDLAYTLDDLGVLATEQGDLASAGSYFERALTIRQELAPNSSLEAQTLHALAMVERKRFQPERAAEVLDQALTSLEGQIRRLGVSLEAQGRYRATYWRTYRDSIEVLLQLNREEQAFHTLERFRARSLLALLAERDLGLATDLPEELASQRRSLSVRHDRALARLAGLSPEQQPEVVAALREELSGLYRERDQLAARIRQASPRLAAIEYPQPLTAAEAQEVLDSGTVMLSYSVGEAQTDLFVLDRAAGLSVVTLAVGEEELRRRVRQLRGLIGEAVGGSAVAAHYQASLVEVARGLCGDLVAPAEEWLVGAERLLILPDGPLHALPWGALVRGDAQRREYLVEWKPLHLSLSATLYAELRQRRPEDAGPRAAAQVVAFGDPYLPEKYAAGDPKALSDVRLRAVARRGFGFMPLPATRQEAEGIAALYGGDAHAYVGREATEQRAKAEAPAARVLHFATHATLDERFPLDSALVLTLPETFDEDRDNGLLQVWEIFERVRLDADLVVLSACESALGEELGGEGLIGLTRAFQYAGARSVVASLWQVADASTAELMLGFYRHLRAGLPKDEALRTAQLELIRGPIETTGTQGAGEETVASAPYAWAPFQLYGDWR